MHTLTVHLLPNLCKPEDVRIGKIRFDRARRINRLADITENKNTDLRKLRQPTLRETAKRGRRNLLLQSPPTRAAFSSSVTTVCRSSQNKGKASPSDSKASGKSLAEISVEHSRQQTIKGFIVEVDIHSQSSIHSPKSSNSCRSSTFFFGLIILFGSNRLRTRCGESSFTVAIWRGSSLHVMKYCAFFITTPIFFNS